MNLNGFQGETARALDQVIRNFRSSFDFDSGASRGREGDFQTIGQRDRLEDGAEFVIAVRPLIKDTQAQVQLGIGRYAAPTRGFAERHLSYWSREKTS